MSQSCQHSATSHRLLSPIQPVVPSLPIPTTPKYVNVDITQTDPIVFANTYHYVQDAAADRGWSFVHVPNDENTNSELPYKLVKGRFTINTFTSVMDAADWMDKLGPVDDMVVL